MKHLEKTRLGLLFGASRHFAAETGEGSGVGDSSSRSRRLDRTAAGDTYQLRVGTGHVTIHESSAAGALADTVEIDVALKGRVQLNRDGDDMIIELLDAGGDGVCDYLRIVDQYKGGTHGIEKVLFSDNSEWSDKQFAKARIRGGEEGETLNSDNAGKDVFDSDGGGDDVLIGNAGNDVYWLGRKTDHDEVHETTADSGDAIRIRTNVKGGDVQLNRDGDDMIVEIVDPDGEVRNSLRVKNQYKNDDAYRVESVIFKDMPNWGPDEFASARIRGGKDDERLDGNRGEFDIFDSNGGGNDELYGLGGRDLFWLGDRTGHDTIKNAGSYTGDRIRVKGDVEGDVKLRREGNDLLVEIVEDGRVVSSLRAEDHYKNGVGKGIDRVVLQNKSGRYTESDFAKLRIRGTVVGETLIGSDNRSDIFDSDAGGEDTLRGGGENDTYWLGRGTGKDTVIEALNDRDDVIRIKDGLSNADVRLWRKGDDLFVEVLDEVGRAFDHLKVSGQYGGAHTGVERVLFADGSEDKVLFSSDPESLYSLTIQRGAEAGGALNGRAGLSDNFDSGKGNHTLSGMSGNDVYWLGKNTGKDTIIESAHDLGDQIRIESGVEKSNVNLRRDGADLYVEILEDGTATNWLKVVDHYNSPTHGIESIAFSDGTSWHLAPTIRGTAGVDTLRGTDEADVFDADKGENDILHGGKGKDVYWLGRGTGKDEIVDGEVIAPPPRPSCPDMVGPESTYTNGEGVTVTIAPIRPCDTFTLGIPPPTFNGDLGDEIWIESSIEKDEVRLNRNGRHLYVEVLGKDGEVTDSLKVEQQGYLLSYDPPYFWSRYLNGNGGFGIEKVVYSDGTSWDRSQFTSIEIRGFAGDSGPLYGSDQSDVFNTNLGGNNALYGGGGGDTYWLGHKTDRDTIFGSGSGDVIRIDSDVDKGNVELLGIGNHLYVVTGGNYLKVMEQYSSGSGIDKIVFSDKTEWGAREIGLAKTQGRYSEPSQPPASPSSLAPAPTVPTQMSFMSMGGSLIEEMAAFQSDGASASFSSASSNDEDLANLSASA